MPDHSQLLTQFRRLPDGGWHWALVIRREHVLVDGSRWQLAPEQSEPDGEEATAWKPLTDVVVRGHVHNHGPDRRTCLARVEVAGIVRTVRATGDRKIEDVRSGVPSWSAPAEFERMPLSFERSYGGFDAAGYAREGDMFADMMVEQGAELVDVSRYAYPRNRRGRGFFVGDLQKTAIGMVVPNLDDPDDPIEPDRLVRKTWLDWVDAPAPAALDWLDPTYFPRSHHFGLPARWAAPASRMREIALGAMTPADLEKKGGFPPIPGARAFQGAAAGLSVARLRGGEAITLTNLHSRAEIATRLPLECPVVELRPLGCPWMPASCELMSVAIDLDRERLSMVWSATLPVASQYPPEEFAQTETRVRFS